MNRTRVRLGRLLGMALGLLLAILVAGQAAGGEVGTAYRTPIEGRHLVHPGDTLWDIARARVGVAGDPRPMVEALREANDLGTTPLRAGDLLLIPTAP